MGIKSYKPTSPARRFYSVSDFKEITKGVEPEKSLLEHQTRTGGRNHHGRITSRFRGGGHKQRYRILDWKRDKIGITAKVCTSEGMPRAAFHSRSSIRCQMVRLAPRPSVRAASSRFCVPG